MPEPAYQSWIEENYPDSTAAYGNCGEATVRMSAQFPNLKRVWGVYLCPIWGQREHWWLTSPDGSIVDPTAGQFPSKGAFDYIEEKDFNERGIRIPTGVCPDCGASVYGTDFCDAICESSYRASLGGILSMTRKGEEHAGPRT